MDKNLQKLARLIFKDQFSEFEIFVNDYFSDLKEFQTKYEKILLKWFDKEDFNELEEYLNTEFLLIIYGKYLNKIYDADWSGEEYIGQVKGTLTKILKTYEKPTFKWSYKDFRADLERKNIRRGEYMGLLFRALDKEVSDLGFQLLFIELFDDTYYYTLLPKSEIAEALTISSEKFCTYDSRIYTIRISALGNAKAKVMLYLKNKHQIPLNEISDYIEKLPIVVESGCNVLRIKELEKQLQKIGCQYEIIEE